jgi:FdhD protein
MYFIYIIFLEFFYDFINKIKMSEKNKNPIKIENFGVMNWPIHILKSSSPSIDEETKVIVEEPLNIKINGQTAAVLMRLPGAEKELAVGFCIGEGIIRSFADIYIMHHCGMDQEDNSNSAYFEESRNIIEIKAKEEAVDFEKIQKIAQLIRSGCGSIDVRAPNFSLPKIKSKVTMSKNLLFTLTKALRTSQRNYKLAGGVHAAAIFTMKGEMLIFYEDIGRHNAADKVIGWGLIKGISLEDKLLLITGRTSYEIILKAANVGLPIVASISSPTSLAVKLSNECKCTLIGYLRANRMNIYTHPFRIKG